MANAVSEALGRTLARYLTRPTCSAPVATTPPERLASTLRPGDVLLVEGDTRISIAIKYLTQSTWSHAALYVGPRADLPRRNGEIVSLVEADLHEGVRAVPLAEYADFHTRVCRPIGLPVEDCERVVGYALGRLGHRYDLKNVLDLARYLIRTPPVPTRWRRRMIALGSGDPTRAICSTLIAQAFQSIRYPILPEITREKLDDPRCQDCYRELLNVRHHSLFAPRDFDVSPYFAVVKPALTEDFDYRTLAWAEPAAGERSDPRPRPQSGEFDEAVGDRRERPEVVAASGPVQRRPAERDRREIGTRGSLTHGIDALETGRVPSGKSLRCP